MYRVEFPLHPLTYLNVMPINQVYAYSVVCHLFHPRSVKDKKKENRVWQHWWTLGSIDVSLFLFLLHYSALSSQSTRILILHEPNASCEDRRSFQKRPQHFSLLPTLHRAILLFIFSHYYFFLIFHYFWFNIKIFFFSMFFSQI